MNVRESLISEKLKKESEEHEKSKKELVKLNKKLCDKQNEIVKLKTDFQKMKRRNGVLEEENRLRKQPKDPCNSTEKKNEVSSNPMIWSISYGEIPIIDPRIKALNSRIFHKQKLKRVNSMFNGVCLLRQKIM